MRGTGSRDLREKVLSEYAGANWTQQELDEYDNFSKEIINMAQPEFENRAYKKYDGFEPEGFRLPNSTERLEQASARALLCKAEAYKLRYDGLVYEE